MKNTGFYPGAAPAVTNDGITVDLMLQQPERIARYIADLTAVGMFTDRIFSHTGVTGGALLYDVAIGNNLFADDQAGIIAPGASYPIIDASEGTPKTTMVDKIGGKFGVTDEAARRNDMNVLQRRAAKVANTMVRDLDALGVSALNKALTEYNSDIIEVQSAGWKKANTTKKADETKATSIRADINKANAEATKQQMGYTFDLLLLHPDDNLELENNFDDDQALDRFLGSKGLEVISSPLAKAGEGLLIASSQVGVMGVEQAISSTTWRDEDRDTTWTKTAAVMAYAVTDPQAIIRLTGIATAG